MGIDVFVFDFLLDYKGRNLGDALCLGRQGFHVSQQPAPWLRAKELLALRFPEDEPQRLIQADGYSETFLRYLGAQSVTALDFSPFEGAQLVHDLNKRIPPDLEQRFDFILDGGTLEHVFNFPMAIANVKSMLRVGGLFVSVNAANNQLGHGLYQFSPELFWRIFSQETGFIIENMILVPMGGTGSPQRIKLSDPAGLRQEIGATPTATYLMFAARRERSNILLGDVYQSDYELAWGDRQRT